MSRQQKDTKKSSRIFFLFCILCLEKVLNRRLTMFRWTFRWITMSFFGVGNEEEVKSRHLTFELFDATTIFMRLTWIKLQSLFFVSIFFFRIYSLTTECLFHPWCAFSRSSQENGSSLKYPFQISCSFVSQWKWQYKIMLHRHKKM